MEAGGHALVKLDLAEVPVGGFVDLVMEHPLNAVQGEIFRHRLQVVVDGSSSTQLFHLTLRQNQRIVHALEGNAYASLEARPAAAGGRIDFAAGNFAGNFDWDVRYVDSEGFEIALFDLPAVGGTKSDSLFERLRLPQGPGVLKAKVRFSLEGNSSSVHEAEFPVLPAAGVSDAVGLGFGHSPDQDGSEYSGPLPPRLLPLGSPSPAPENYLQAQLGMWLRIGDTAAAIRARGALLYGSPWRRALTGRDSEPQGEERHAQFGPVRFRCLWARSGSQRLGCVAFAQGGFKPEKTFGFIGGIEAGFPSPPTVATKSTRRGGGRAPSVQHLDPMATAPACPRVFPACSSCLKTAAPMMWMAASTVRLPS